METASPAFSLILSILLGILFLTGIALYLSFGPPSKSLEEPWDRQED